MALLIKPLVPVESNSSRPEAQCTRRRRRFPREVTPAHVRPSVLSVFALQRFE